MFLLFCHCVAMWNISVTACFSPGRLWHSEGGSLGHQQPHHQWEERAGELGFGQICCFFSLMDFDMMHLCRCLLYKDEYVDDAADYHTCNLVPLL